MTQQTTAAFGAVPDATVPESVQTTLARLQAPIVAGVDLTESGARILVIDVAAGRLLAASELYTDVAASALDDAITEHLVTIGRVTRPTNADWTRELRSLARRGRQRLIGSDGAFIMGDDHVRLFRVTRRDVQTATASLAAALSQHISTLLSSVTKGGAPSGSDRAALTDGATEPPVVLTASHTTWPGLSSALTSIRGRTVITVDDIDWQPGTDAPVPPSDAVPSGAAPVPDMTQSGRLDTVDRGGEAITEELAAITDRLHPTRVEPGVTVGSAAVTTHGDAPERRRPRDRSQRHSGQHFSRQHFSRQRWLLGGAVVAVVVILGAATAVAFSQNSPSPEPSGTASVTSTPVPTTPPTTEYANPKDLVEARKPAILYAPPPPPAPSTSAAVPRQRPAPRSQHRPRAKPTPRLVIPIPGRPPIVVP